MNAQLPFVTNPDISNRDIVIVSPQLWGDVWVSKHWIAHELSQRNRVMFVEPPVWLGGIARHPWHNSSEWPRLQSTKTISNNLTVFRPKLWPPITRKASVAQQVAHAVQSAGMQDVLLLNFGTNYELLDSVKSAVSVYYCVDPAFPQPGEENNEQLTCERSDMIYVVSERYRKELSRYSTRAPVHVIPHGFPVGYAQRVAADTSVGRPAELESISGKIAGFIGSIHDSYVDVSRLEFVAQERPEYDFVLIGPYRNNPLGPDLSVANLKRLRALSNVHLLGPRHFFDLPSYTKFFSVGLVIVNVDEYAGKHMTHKRTHFKWLSYFSQGLPVVAPTVFETAGIEELVYFGRDTQDYLAQLDEAMIESESSPARKARAIYAEQYSFDKTIERIVRPILEMEQTKAS